MSKAFSFDPAAVRQQIASCAARLIAEDGMDYHGAKRKAVQQLFGTAPKGLADFLPNNREIEDEVRLYQQLFQSESQPLRLAELRRKAVGLMQELADYEPYLTGAVLNGTASEHSPIRLELFVDSAKDVQIFLLNLGAEFDVHEETTSLGLCEVVHTLWDEEDALLYLYPSQALRQQRKAARGDENGHERITERANLSQLLKQFGTILSECDDYEQ